METDSKMRGLIIAQIALVGPFVLLGCLIIYVTYGKWPWPEWADENLSIAIFCMLLLIVLGAFSIVTILAQDGAVAPIAPI